VSVLVVEELDGALLGASVLVGEGADAAPLGSTDASGLVRADGDVEVVSALAPDRTAMTMAGAHADLVTLPLVARRLADRATVTVSVPGFDQIPLEDADYLIARGGFTPARTIDAPINRVEPREGDTVECAGGADRGPCELRLSARVGAQRIVVGVARGTDTGVAGDPSDDELEPVSLLVSGVVDLAANAMVAVDVTEVAATELLLAEVATSPPEGFEAVVGVPGSSLDEGVILWPFNSRGFIVRSLDGASSADWVLGEVREPGGMARSRVIARSAGFVERPLYNLEREWLDPPTEVRLEGARIHVEGELGDALLRLDVFASDGTIAWTAYLVDGRMSIEPPAGIELPASGTIRAMFTDADRGPPGELSFASVEETWTRRASRTIAFDACPWASCR
jgi:hypothetical protein